TQCSNTAGGRTCSDCPDGYEGTGEEGCELIDPCQDVTCGQNAMCLLGMCQCLPGYFGDPQSYCEPPPPTDPCDYLTCDENASCIPYVGCECDPGYSGDGDSCEPNDP